MNMAQRRITMIGLPPADRKHILGASGSRFNPFTPKFKNTFSQPS